MYCTALIGNRPVYNLFSLVIIWLLHTCSHINKILKINESIFRKHFAVFIVYKLREKYLCVGYSPEQDIDSQHISDPVKQLLKGQCPPVLSREVPLYSREVLTLWLGQRLSVEMKWEVFCYRRCTKVRPWSVNFTIEI